MGMGVRHGSHGRIRGTGPCDRPLRPIGSGRLALQNLAGRNPFEGPGIDNPEGLAAEKLRRYRTFEDAARAPPIHGAEVAALDNDQKRSIVTPAAMPGDFLDHRFFAEFALFRSADRMFPR